MPSAKLRHIVIGDATHPDCPFCKLAAEASAVPSRAHAAVPTREPHPAECPCRFCQPTKAWAVIAPWKPWEEEIFDIGFGQADGSIKVTASYRVEHDGALTWLTPDGRAPKEMRARSRKATRS
jgi:hypothetical protein